ncbi:hypothetical protein LK533_05910 [Sphingomonas sp. PL-96]|uniref:CC0125/CC1285 family lipoprotein n=1 Tax=Sphingomonas sp. PL-96 TaxID=2887201 RepID=UPI001E527E1A|nr:hypothetical protein [Sphingomonas sp. PL-96]MCC2976209.1 hypothetical protein [Sphingomonas sp. PL-96]
MLSSRVDRKRIASLGTAIVGALVLAACATPTPYRPATGNGFARTGYSDEQIEPNRFQVSFAGNTLTSRETVERYLLFRAAQLTVERGFDHFVLVDRDTERRTRTYATPDPYWGGGYGGFGAWSPYWRFHGPSFGWRGGWGGWGPYGGGFNDVRTVDKYEAMAEILVGRGPKPANNVRAFDARAVIENLGPRVQMPEQR